MNMDLLESKKTENGISKIGRYTSGVKLMDIDVENDIRVASIAKVREADEETGGEEE